MSSGHWTVTIAMLCVIWLYTWHHSGPWSDSSYLVQSKNHCSWMRQQRESERQLQADRDMSLSHVCLVTVCDDTPPHSASDSAAEWQDVALLHCADDAGLQLHTTTVSHLHMTCTCVPAVINNVTNTSTNTMQEATCNALTIVRTRLHWQSLIKCS